MGLLLSGRKASLYVSDMLRAYLAMAGEAVVE
jgi:hypothetical protein